MAFFLTMWAVTLLAYAADRGGFVSLPGWPGRMRVGLVAALLLAGTDHFLMPERYVPMIEGFLPYPLEIVLFTGACEIAGAMGLMSSRLRKAAGLALAVYFVSVFPANIANALQGLDAPGLPAAQWYYWLRLALQPIAVVWALAAGGLLSTRRQAAVSTVEGRAAGSSGCCGGPAPAGVDACCHKDAVAKQSGKSGCGCQAAQARASESSVRTLSQPKGRCCT